MSVSIIVPAAGKGSRMNTSAAKQFLTLRGIPVIVHLLKRIDMLDEVSGIIVALHEKELDNFNKIIKNTAVTKRVRTVTGGNTRQESVRAALNLVDAGSELVMVHDAARPLVTPAILRDAIAKTKELGATAAAVPVKDTIKEVEGGVVTKTLDRSRLYAIQTPQTFLYEIITQAHENAVKNGITGTDDAALVEKNAQKVFVISGSYDNIKITTNEDIDLAESILHKQRNLFGYY